jgi:NAD(P)-dependent dehydrogenase (short-subunit alcohol dehydrogenase family)
MVVHAPGLTEITEVDATHSLPLVLKPFDLTGKVVLITGATRGMGLEMARGLAEAGADIAVVSRKAQACEAVAVSIQAMGRRALSCPCHVGRWDEIDALVDKVLQYFGKIDVLINNAGMSPVAPSLVETSEALFDKVIGVNLKGPFRLAALCGEHMTKGSGGSIINISSTGSIRPQPHSAPYAAAKAGLNALTTAFAFAYGPKVRVNCILPGPFETDISRAWTDEEMANYTIKSGSALRRLGQPAEIVAAVLYLASDASSYTTGALLRVDGGLP